jgi:hypothetical protein
MRERQFFVHRADIDDFPRTARLPQVAYDRLRYKEHPFEVDVQNGVEIRFGHIPEVRSFLQTCVVDEDIDLSERRDGLFDESLSVRDLSDIGLKRSSSPLRRFNSAHYFVCPVLVLAIADGNVSAFLRQTFRNRSSNSLIAARYSGYFACQPV